MKRKTKRKIGSFLEKTIGGHISVGKLTLYGDNAMRFAGHYSTRKFGYICFRLPAPCGIIDYFLYEDSKIRFYPPYLYFSPNGTPWASTFMLGKKYGKDDWALARVRRRRLGHNFSTNDEHQYKILRKINGIF